MSVLGICNTNLPIIKKEALIPAQEEPNQPVEHESHSPPPPPSSNKKLISIGQYGIPAYSNDSETLWQDTFIAY